MKHLVRAFQQWEYLFRDVSRSVNRRWWRLGTTWFTTSFWILVRYRSDRFFYLLFGRAWQAIRVLFLPIGFFLRPWITDAEIHYRADIQGGLKILHPSLGVVLSGNLTCGRNLMLSGGNCIGGRRQLGGDVPLIVKTQVVSL